VTRAPPRYANTIFVTPVLKRRDLCVPEPCSRRTVRIAQSNMLGPDRSMQITRMHAVSLTLSVNNNILDPAVLGFPKAGRLALRIPMKRAKPGNFCLAQGQLQSQRNVKNACKCLRGKYVSCFCMQRYSQLHTDWNTELILVKTRQL